MMPRTWAQVEHMGIEHTVETATAPRTELHAVIVRVRRGERGAVERGVTIAAAHERLLLYSIVEGQRGTEIRDP
jgi:hypothetical protein